VRAALAGAALGLLAWSPPAWGCIVAPLHQVVHSSELVRRTSSIVLAETTSITHAGDRGFRYHFRTVEVLKGERIARFTVDVSSPYGLFGRRVPDTDFNGHRDLRFWDRDVTRQGTEPDCQIYPRFAPGSRYLVFRGPPYHWRSFERIVRSDDWWLAAVRVEVRSGGRTRGLVRDVVGWLRDHLAVDVIEIESCTTSPPTIKRLEHLAGWEGRQPPFELDFGWRPSPACQPGSRFLAAHYDEDEFEPGAGLPAPRVFPLVEGMVDFSRIETEIEITGPRRLSLEELRRRLR
jgi:hypothetical protein